MQRITLTGADERTDIDQLVELVNRYPHVELGLLYTSTPEGRNRYPSLRWLLRTAAECTGRIAIHVCGQTARKQLMEGSLDALTRHAPRVQVNGLLTPQELAACATRVRTVITQHHEGNAALVDVRLPNHALLIDSSGGRGISPQAWMPPATHKPVGFAGGMGPDNLRDELDRILPVSKYNAWVDMEGKLRTLRADGDWFDIQLARYCASQFDAHLADNRYVLGGLVGGSSRVPG